MSVFELGQLCTNTIMPSGTQKVAYKVANKIEKSYRKGYLTYYKGTTERT